MKIIRIVLSSFRDGGLKKFFLIMKLTLILILFVSLHMSASVWSQTTTMSLKLKNSTLQELFTQIEKNSDYRFFYNNDEVDLNQRISVNVRDKSVGIILTTALEGKPYSFKESEDKLIVIEKIGAESDLSGTGTQQQKLVTGKVTDQSGASLPGVSVVVKGTTTGVTTDNSGNFSLAIPQDANILVFSFIGKRKLDVKIDGKSMIVVQLEEEIVNLDDVAVIGYGTMKRKDITGSISSITSKSLEGVKSGGITQMLQGRAPGVYVQSTGGNPAADNTRIRIRGANSISGDNSPLFVVDGNYGGSYNILDVESIEILKDASATAIYGSRGANGVVLITTKKANSETLKISARSNLALNFIANKYDKMNALEYAEYNNSVGYSAYSAQKLSELRTNPNGTDWQDKIYEVGVGQGYSVNMTGGSKKSKFFLSGTYGDNKGILNNSWSKGMQFRFNLDTELNKFISFNFQANAGTSRSINSSLGRGGDKTNNPILESLLWSPVENVFLADGFTYNRNDNYGSRGINPLLILKQNNRNSGGGYNVLGEMKVNILNGLNFSTKASTSYYTSNSQFYNDPEMTGDYASAGQGSSYPITSWWTASTLNYTKTFFTKHNVSAMVGFEEMQDASGGFGVNASNLSSPSVGWNNIGNGSSISANSGYSNSAMRSYFARGTYNYDSKYYLTATWRADGSSKFGQNNKFGYFPSFGLGWRVSEESFLKGTEIFENFKLRGGWGITGSQAVGSYKTFSPMDGGNSWNGHMYGTSTTYVGQRVGLAGNPNLQWEQTEQSNIGADVSVLKGKLSGTIDYYMKNTSKLLTSKTMPGMVGGGRTLVNLGSIENKGFEIGINYIVLDHQDLKYDLGFNYSRNRNKIKDIGEEKKLWGDTYASGILALSPFVMMPGYALGTIYGYEYLGIWQTADATEAAKFGQSPGDYRYEDLNGDKSYGSEDYQVIGDCNPKYTWGFTNHFTYKNIDFSFLIEGVQGRDVLNMSYALATNSIDISRAVSLRKARERWSESNPGAEFAKIGTTNKMQLNSSQFVQDGSFVKLRNVSIGYRLPQTMTKIGDIQFNVSAQNVLCFTKYKGYDPEVSSSGSSDSSSGSDFFAYPNARSVTFSVSLVF